MGGFVGGAAIPMMGASPVQRRVATGLCGWIGLTLSVIPALFVICFSIPAYRAQATPPLLPGEAGATLITNLLVVIVGTWLLSLVRSATPAWRKGDVYRNFWDSVRSIFAPREIDKLQLVTAALPISVEECRARLEALSRPAFGALGNWMQFLAARENQAAAQFQGETVVFAANLRGAAFPFRARITGGKTTRLNGQIEMEKSMRFYLGFWFGFLALMTPLVLLSGLSAVNGNLTEQDQALFGVWILTSLWDGGLFILRTYRRMAKVHETTVIAYLRENFGAEIQTSPRRWVWPWF